MINQKFSDSFNTNILSALSYLKTRIELKVFKTSIKNNK